MLRYLLDSLRPVEVGRVVALPVLRGELHRPRLGHLLPGDPHEREGFVVALHDPVAGVVGLKVARVLWRTGGKSSKEIPSIKDILSQGKKTVRVS